MDLDVVTWGLLFLAGAVVLVRASVVLVSAADDLATVTGLSRLFVGTLVLAAATSLPEVVVDLSAVGIAGSPDLAVGDLFGSGMANMAILAVIDLSQHRRVWPSVELGHARVAAIAMALTTLALLGILAPLPRIGWVGVETVLIAVVYVSALRWIHRTPFSPRGAAAVPTAPTTAVAAPTTATTVPAGAPPDKAPALRRVLARFGLATVGIAVSAPVVAVSADGLAEVTGVAETAVGVVLLAVTTSLPELLVSLSAIRIGATDLAVGNLFGSNAANMAVLFLADVVWTEGPLLDAVDPTQAVAGVGVLLLTAIAVAAIVQGDGSRMRRLEPDALLLLLTYGVLLTLVVAGGP